MLYFSKQYQIYKLFTTLFTDDLKLDLETYISEEFSKVKLIRTQKREGLIRARVIGADSAIGEVSLGCLYHRMLST